MTRRTAINLEFLVAALATIAVAAACGLAVWYVYGLLAQLMGKG